MAHDITTIPNIQVDLIDPRTGKMDRAWRMFFENLWKLQGSGTTDITVEDLQKSPQFEPLIPFPDDVSPPQIQLLADTDEFRLAPPIINNVPVISQIVTAFTAQTSIVVTHNFGKYPVVNVIDNTGAVVVPLTITHGSLNAFTVTFSAATTGNIIAVIGY